MAADGSQIRRMSFVQSNYCTSPAWSPKGDRIAFVCRAEGRFQVFTARPDGSDALQLTSYGNNEDPIWAPNASLIAFATTFGGGDVYQIAIMRPDGSNLRQITKGRISSSQPTWGPVPGEARVP
jgi:TolB protein